MKLKATFLSSLLLVLGLLGQSPAWAVELQSYFERPDILQIEAHEHPELEWQAWRQAHLEAAAAFLELYPTEHLYFLARDAELLYDAVRLISRDEPATLARLHLLNVSRGNMRHEHLLEYLAQEGLTPERLREDASFQPIFIDTGFSGTIPRVIAERMPLDVRGKIKTHLLVSNNAAMPSLRSFLLPINPAILGQSPSLMHGTIIGYEHIPRAMNRSDAYQRIADEWHPVSRSGTSSDGQVNATTARHYQEDLSAYLRSSSSLDRLQTSRALWRELRRNWTRLPQDAWIEFLKATLASAGENRPAVEAVIRDFLEWATVLGRAAAPQAPLIATTDIGLNLEIVEHSANKAQLIAKFPQWAPILENPETQIPALIQSGQLSTLGAILDVIYDFEFMRLSMRTIVDNLETPSVYSLAEALLDKLSSKHNTWVLELFHHDKTALYPELLRLAIEKAAPGGMGAFATFVLTHARWANYPELLRLAVEKATPDDIGTFISRVFSRAHWAPHPELLRLVLERAESQSIKSFEIYVFTQPYWKHTVEVEIFRAAAQIHDLQERRAYLREQFGPYSWESEAPGVCEQQMLEASND